MLLGAVVILRGTHAPRRREQLSWIPLLAGLLGVPRIPGLASGVLQPLLFLPVICLTRQAGEVRLCLVPALREGTASCCCV